MPRSLAGIELDRDAVNAAVTLPHHNGGTIIAHNVVLIAAKALAKAAALNGTELPSASSQGGHADPERGQPRPVRERVDLPEQGGNPYNKPVPVVRLDGATGTLELKAVAWPQGSPSEEQLRHPANRFVAAAHMGRKRAGMRAARCRGRGRGAELMCSGFGGSPLSPSTDARLPPQPEQSEER